MLNGFIIARAYIPHELNYMSSLIKTVLTWLL